MIKIVNAIFQSSASLERGENPVTKRQLSTYGAQVEASFSMMNTIITDKASTMMISTYEAIQPAQEKTATQFFKRTDAVSSPVDKSLAAHMQRAYSRHIAAVKKRKAIAAERDAQQGVKTQPQQPTKRKATSVMPCPLKRSKH